jgi:hypothetical protein
MKNDSALKTAALIYDFDGTLARGNLPEHGLFQKLSVLSPDSFWAGLDPLPWTGFLRC